MDDKELTSMVAKALGKKGGQATREKYGNGHFKKISQLAAQIRKEKAAAKRKTAS